MSCIAADDQRNGDTKQDGCENCRADAPADAVLLCGAVILGDEGGKGIAKILHGHVGEGIDFDCCGERGHNRDAEAVYQALHHENSEVHDGLLKAGEERILQNL